MLIFHYRGGFSAGGAAVNSRSIELASSAIGNLASERHETSQVAGGAVYSI